MAYFDDLLTPPKQGGFFDDLINPPAPTPPRGTLREIATGLRTGFTEELPRTLGQALQYGTSDSTNPIAQSVNEYGTSLAQRAKERAALPENQLQPEQHGVITNALAGGAQMLAPSIVPPLVVGAGLAAAGAASPALAVGGTAGLVTSSVLGAVPAGLAQAQQTFENVKEAGGTDAAATSAARKTGLIEAGGEALGTLVGGKFVGIAGNTLRKAAARTAAGAVAGATDAAIAKPFFRDLIKTALAETGTEIAQAGSQAVVGRNAGVDVNPWEQMKSVVGPTLGMTTFLAPFGLHASFRNSARAREIDGVLKDASVAPEQRLAVVDGIYQEAKANKVSDAEQWYAGAVQDVAAGLPVRREVVAASPVDQAKGEMAVKAVPSAVSAEVVGNEAVIVTDSGVTVKAPVADVVAQVAAGKPVEELAQGAQRPPTKEVQEGAPPVQENANAQTNIARPVEASAPDAATISATPQADVLADRGNDRGSVGEVRPTELGGNAGDTRQAPSGAGDVSAPGRMVQTDEAAQPSALGTATQDNSSGVATGGARQTSRVGFFDTAYESIAKKKYAEHVAVVDGLPEGAAVEFAPAGKWKKGMLAHVDGAQQQITILPARMDTVARQLAKTHGVPKEQVLPILYDEVVKHESEHMAQLGQFRLDKANREIEDEAYAKGSVAAAVERIKQIKTGQGVSTEVVTPEQDVPAGMNMAGEALYDRTDGSRYRIRTDRADRPGGYPDFGGDLAPVVSRGTPVGETQSSVSLTSETQALPGAAARGTTIEQVQQEAQAFFGKSYDRLTKNNKLAIVQSVQELPEGSPLRSASGRVVGAYLRKEKKMYLVADNVVPGEVADVIKHEAVHALLREDPKFVKAKDKILADFNKYKGGSFAAAREKIPYGTPSSIYTEEALAYWLQNPENHKHSLFKRVMAAIKAALFRLGFTPRTFTDADLAQIFTQGAKAWGQAGTTSVNEFAQNALLSVKEAGRKIQNLPAFKKWFAGSKVVDEKGQPLVVYHGTPFGNFLERAKKINEHRRKVKADRETAWVDLQDAWELRNQLRQEHKDWKYQSFDEAPLLQRPKLRAANSKELHRIQGDLEYVERLIGELTRRRDTLDSEPTMQLQEVDAFLRTGDNDSGYLGRGVYFTADKGLAKNYSTFASRSAIPGEQRTPYVYEVYLDTKNPFYPGTTRVTPDMAAREEELYRTYAPMRGDVDVFNSARSSARSAMLQEFGYDGVIGESAGKEGTEYVVFRPTQIKSIFNDKWDGANPDILFSQVNTNLRNSRASLGTALGAISNPRSKLHNLYVQTAPQWLSVTPLNTLVQTFGKRVAQLKEFSKALGEVVFTKEDIVSTSAVLHEKAVELAKKGPGVDVLNRAAGTASFNQMTPWLDWDKQDWVPQTGTIEQRMFLTNQRWKDSGMKKATGKTYMQAYREAVAAYEALGSEELKKAYQKVVGHIADTRAREKNNLLTLIERNTEPDSEERASMMQRFNATFSDLKGAYWPLSRFGDFILNFTDADGFTWAKHYTTIGERDADKAALLESGIDSATFKESYKNKQPHGAATIPQELLGQLDEAVRKKYMQGVDPADETAVALAMESASDTINDMTQIWLRWQPETSALKNSVQRKNTKGFSEDMMRGYLDYMQRHASNIAWTEQGRKIEEQLKSLSEDIREKRAEEGAVNTDLDNMLLNELRARIQALRTVNVGRVASGLGKLGTAYFMTSPSIALVQMSQLGVLTLPKMAVMYGPAKAAKALAKGVAAAFSRKYTREPMFSDPAVNTVYENLRETVTAENRDMAQARGKELGDQLYSETEILEQISRLTDKQKKFLVLREAMARNLLDISAAHEAYELTRGKNPNSLGRKVFNYAMLPMSLSELASRKAAVLSTYELATADGDNFYDAMNKVGEVVDDTLYSYAKENKGSAMQGGFTRVLLQFQHYRIMTGIRLALLFKNAIKNEDPATQAAARKEFVGIMGMTGLLAGTMGLPLANVTFAALNLVLGSDDEPYDAKLEFANWLRENLGETGADVAAKGAPSLLGADLSRRLGLGDIYGSQAEPPTGMHGRELAAWWAANQLGPVFSVGAGWAQGYDEIVNKGNYERGLEAAVPKPIKDVMKSIRFAAEGVKTGAGKRLLSDAEIGVDEIALTALGFNTDEVAKAMEAEGVSRKISTKLSERRGRLIGDAAKGILSGDTEGALEAVLTFNKKMPAFAIRGGDITSAVRRRISGDLGVASRRETLISGMYEVPDYME